MHVTAGLRTSWGFIRTRNGWQQGVHTLRHTVHHSGLQAHLREQWLQHAALPQHITLGTASKPLWIRPAFDEVWQWRIWHRQVWQTFNTLWEKHTVYIFKRIRKIAKSDYHLRCVCPSIRMEQLSSHWTDFDEIRNLRFLRKPVEEIQVSLKSAKNNGYFT